MFCCLRDMDPGTGHFEKAQQARLCFARTMRCRGQDKREVTHTELTSGEVLGEEVLVRDA